MIQFFHSGDCIQAGYLWKLSEIELLIPDPTEWGWKIIDKG